MPFQINKHNNLKQQCLAKTKKARKTNADIVATKIAVGMAQNDLVPELKIEWRAVAELAAPKRRVRKAVSEHVARAIRSIKTFGMVSPLTVRGDVVIDGHTRLAAAKALGMKRLPCIDVSHLSASSARMLAISLNRLAERGEWEMDELNLELSELEIEGLDLTVSFFSNQELDIILTDDPDSDAAERECDLEPQELVTTIEGDLWLLGEHRVLCGNSLDAASFKTLLGDNVAHAVLTDVPYNVQISGNVSGLGSKKHGEFKMASGEMSAQEFYNFLLTSHQHCASHLREGGVFYSFIDWRSDGQLISAAKEAGLQHINTAVWYKGSGGMNRAGFAGGSNS